MPLSARPDFPALTLAAEAAAEKAYARYSGFHVGAALLLSNGEIITGGNVENVSYGLTICAERSALVRAVARFGPDIRVAAAVVVNANHAPSPPCGACRQVLAEFMSPDAPIAFPAEIDGTLQQVTTTFGDLLPHSFLSFPKKSTEPTA